MFEAFKEILSYKYSLNQSLDIILGDMSIHVKKKIMKWDVNQVNKIHELGDSAIAHDLLESGAKFMSMNQSLNENLGELGINVSHLDEVTSPV